MGNETIQEICTTHEAEKIQTELEQRRGDTDRKKSQGDNG
jgi:hypothetical protein